MGKWDFPFYKSADLTGLHFTSQIDKMVKWTIELELELTNTHPNDTEANAAGRSGNARALRKQSKCGVIHEGEVHWPKFSQKLQKANYPTASWAVW